MADYTEGASTPVNVDTTDHLRGTEPGGRGGRWRLCHICGLEFRESDMTSFEGKWYGNQCGDSKDIPSILLMRRGKKG